MDYGRDPVLVLNNVVAEMIKGEEVARKATVIMTVMTVANKF